MKLFEKIVALLEQRKGEAFLVGVVSFGVVAFVDCVTPEEVTFSIFYLIPIAFFLWFFGGRLAWLIAIVSVLVWPSEHVLRGGFVYFQSFPVYWDAAVRLGFYAIFIFSLLTIKGSINRLKVVNAELSEALNEVRQLRGLIPICSSCKKIRDDTQEWVVLEKYIQAHSDAKFSHGLCPDCMKILYPDVVEKLPTG